MNAAPVANKIPVANVRIDQAEGPVGRLVHGDVSTFSDANAVLRKIAADAPKEGGYFKTDVVVTWADGFQCSVREDVVHISKAAPDLAAHVKRFWQFHAGFWRPDHIDQDRYDAMVAENPKLRDQATEALKRYSLDDPPAAKVNAQAAQALAPVVSATSVPSSGPWPTPAQVDALVASVAAMTTRVEGNPSRDAARNRAVAMELRKAMAALIRTRDLLR